MPDSPDNPPSQRRFVFLDRDGTVNVDKHYLSDPDQLELLDGVGQGLRQLQNLGLGLIVVTNQSAIGRGYFDLSRLEEIHARLRQLLQAESVQVDAIYFCPHSPEADCSCRKPRTGMFDWSVRDFGLRPGDCFMIGDKLCDIEFGQAAGATTILVQTGYGQQTVTEGVAQPDHIAADLPAAAAIIATLVGRNGLP